MCCDIHVAFPYVSDINVALQDFRNRFGIKNKGDL